MYYGYCHGHILRVTFPYVQYSLALFWLGTIWKGFIHTETPLSLSLSCISFLPSLSVNSVYSSKEKHITQQFSIHLFFPSPPLSVFVCSAPSALAPAFYTSLYVLSDGNRQLLKARMKCQHATVCGPVVPKSHLFLMNMWIFKNKQQIYCSFSCP